MSTVDQSELKVSSRNKFMEGQTDGQTDGQVDYYREPAFQAGPNELALENNFVYDVRYCLV